jgi:hypothetical protein
VAAGLFLETFANIWIEALPKERKELLGLLLDRQAPLGFARDRQDRRGLDPIASWGGALPWADSSV